MHETVFLLTDLACRLSSCPSSSGSLSKKKKKKSNAPNEMASGRDFIVEPTWAMVVMNVMLMVMMMMVVGCFVAVQLID